MDIVKKTIELLKQLFLNRTLWIGFVICFAMFSKYILGPENLVEQLGEKFTKDKSKAKTL
jgi:hypothetical protein